MIPCVLQADMLIESSRYHATVSALDEIMDLSATSTLANYDEYLLDRFGLLAVDQKNGNGDADRGLTEIYKKYFDENLSGSRIAWKSDAVTVHGLYPLTDSAVIKNQIMEVSKLAAPTEFAASTIMDLIDMLTEDAKGLQVFNSYADAAASVADELDNMAKTIESGEELKNLTVDLEVYKNRYIEKFTAFKVAAEAVAAAKRTIAAKEQEMTLKIQEAASEQGNSNTFSMQIQTLNQSIGELKLKYDTNEITEEEYKKQKDEIEKQIKSLEKSKKDADTKSSSAQTAANKAQQELTSEQNSLQEKINNAEAARTDYAEAIQNVKTTLKNVDDETNNIINNMKSIAEGVVDVSNKFNDASNAKQSYNNNKEIKNLDKQIEKLREEKRKVTDNQKKAVIDEKIAKAIEEKKKYNDDEKIRSDTKVNDDNIHISMTTGIDAAVETINDSLNEYDKNKITIVCDGLEALYNKITVFRCSSDITSDFVCDSNSYYIELEGYIPSGSLDAMLDKLNEIVDSTTGENSPTTILKLFSEVFDTIFKINIFYDASLDAIIQTDIIANESGGIDDVFTSIGQVAEDLKNLTSPIWKFWELSKKLKAIVRLGRDLVRCAKCIMAYAESMVAKITGVGELFSGGLDGAYEKLILSDYLNLICANRTTYSRSAVMTGYSFSNAGMGNSAHAEDTIAIVGDLTVLINTIKNFGTGDSKQFCGAETEYLLTGSRSELVNQTAVFLQLYFLRLIIDIIPVLMDEEVQILAGASTLGAPLVYLLYVLLEPFLDSIFIANGNELDFIKHCIYLTPTGFATGLGRIEKVKLDTKAKSETRTKFDKFLKGMNNVKDMRIFNGRRGKKDDDSFFTADYSTYMLIFLVMQSSDVSLNRFSNIILTECKNRKNSFDIGKTYTYLSAEAKGEYKPFLSAAAMITNFVYGGVKRQVRGY